MANNVAAELMQHLAAKHLYPKPAWLQSFLTTTRPNTALAALKQTCLFRLLATDITLSLDQPAASVLPADVLKGQVQSRYLAGPIICQVLDIEDIGQSRWSQVEAIEARERGEMTKGREIVRVIEPEDDDSSENDTESGTEEEDMNEGGDRKEPRRSSRETIVIVCNRCGEENGVSIWSSYQQ